MKIKNIKLNKFKRFTDLTIKDIPETARLIVLAGPNGCGKTSLFEAFNYYYQLSGFGIYNQQDYFEKKDDTPTIANWQQNTVGIEFFNNPNIDRESIKSKFYFRTAYRNDPNFNVNEIRRQNNPTENIRLSTLMQNDRTVSENYQRLVFQTLAGVYDKINENIKVIELRDKLIGRIKKSLTNVFDEDIEYKLVLSSIGDPLVNGSFYFEKGHAKDFHYKNLSAGEKSAFDLLLDMIIKSSYYSDAIICIDEPEAHMHTKLQSKVLRELYNLTPKQSQLWISTHSVGMLKEAEIIENEQRGTVVFLDFDGKNFDSTEIMRPSKIDKSIWDKFFELAFDDFSQLIAPKKIVFCEGTNEGRKCKNFDAQIYKTIFGNQYHDTQFISVGSSTELEDIENKSIKIVSNILKSTKIIKFIDRDDRSNEEVRELLSKDIKCSKRRHIESYLLDDEVIKKLCDHVGMSEHIDTCLEAKQNAIQDSIKKGNPSDDIKSASGLIYNELKKILSLTQCGNNTCAFLRDTIAPLITSDMQVYKELEKEIFG